MSPLRRRTCLWLSCTSSWMTEPRLSIKGQWLALGTSTSTASLGWYTSWVATTGSLIRWNGDLSTQKWGSRILQMLQIKWKLPIKSKWIQSLHIFCEWLILSLNIYFLATCAVYWLPWLLASLLCNEGFIQSEVVIWYFLFNVLSLQSFLLLHRI